MRDPRGGDPFAVEQEPPRRRNRSASPPERERHEAATRRGSYDRPSPKRSRRDEGHYDRFRDPSPHHAGRSPPRHRYDDGPRERGRHGRGPREERYRLSFKEFILDQPGDLSPEEAQMRYRMYLADFTGGEVRAEFLDKKDSEAMRVAFDPRSFEKALIARNEAAKQSAVQFRSDYDSGALDPNQDGFNQGMFDKAPKPGKKKEEQAVGKDEIAEERDSEVEKEGEKEEGDLSADPGNKEEGKREVKEPPAEDGPTVFAPSVCWLPKRIEEDLSLAIRLIRKVDAEKGIDSNPLLPSLSAEKDKEGGEPSDDKRPDQDTAPASMEDPPVHVIDGNLDECISRLDLLMTYLFNVHGIDYYAGYEFTAHEFPMRLTGCRILRGPRPDPEEKLTEEEVKEQLLLVEETVNANLEKRIREGDPLELRCQKRKVEELLDQWVEDQVIQVNESKWGNRLSNKMFLEKKFVLKHVRSKHEDKLLAEKERIQDEIYFENFKAWKAEEAEANRGFNSHPRSEPGASRSEGRRGGSGGHGMRGGGMRGGGRGGGRRMMGPAPMFLPGMGPMMMIPAGPAPLMAPMIIAPGFDGGRGWGGGGRGGGLGGRGGIRPAPGSYVDLDDPKNSRQVLDYGDL